MFALGFRVDGWVFGCYRLGGLHSVRASEFGFWAFSNSFEGDSTSLFKASLGLFPTKHSPGTAPKR